MEKIKLDSFPTPYTKKNSKWQWDLIIKNEAIWVLSKYMGTFFST